MLDTNLISGPKAPAVSNTILPSPKDKVPVTPKSFPIVTSPSVCTEIPLVSVVVHSITKSSLLLLSTKVAHLCSSVSR